MMVKAAVEFQIQVLEKCQKQYKKMVKKDIVLKKIIQIIMDELKLNPYLGEELHSNFDGWRAIHFHGNKYRIVYKIEIEPIPKIIILCIGHRKNAYSDLARLLGMGF